MDDLEYAQRHTRALTAYIVKQAGDAVYATLNLTIGWLEAWKVERKDSWDDVCDERLVGMKALVEALRKGEL